MSQTSDKILKNIDEKQIKPKSKWVYLSKDYMLWIFLAVLLFLSALAVSTILFILTTQDWDVYDYLDRSFLAHVFISIPHFWVLIFILLVLIIYYEFIHTKYGYRYAISRIFLSTLVAGFILGAIFFFCGANSGVHDFLSRNVPFYDKLIYYKEDIWDNPERGLLGGEVIAMQDKNNFTLKDFQGNIWQIVGDNIAWSDNVVPQKGVKIKIIGSLQSGNNFYGKIIRCWRIPLERGEKCFD